jgi:hypothetical protein
VARVLALATVALLSACGPNTGDGGPPPSGADLRGWLDYFEAEGALVGRSEEQLDVLERAAAEGELTYEDVVGLINLAFECMEAQGLAPNWREPLDDYGYPVPFYEVGESETLGSDASQAVMDDCVRRYSGLAEQLYLWQPTNTAIYEAYWDKNYRIPMIACLHEHGVTIEDDAPRNDIERAAVELNMPTGPQDNPVFGPDCFREAGLG